MVAVREYFRIAALPATMPEIHEGYILGALGRIIQLHEIYYDEFWDFEYEFSRQMAVELAEFFGRYDETGNRLWLVMDDPNDTGKQEIHGAIVVDGQKAGNEGACIRWVILTPELQGEGIGRELMEKAMTYCEEENFDRVYL
jgi:GNAT superfamily N-acetyltransferase